MSAGRGAPSSDITRRHALRLLAAFGLLPLGCDDPAPRAPGPSSPGDRLVALRPDRQAAAVIGRTWLDAQPDAPSTAELLRELAPDESLEPNALREAWQRAHRKDLLAERYESISGWQLSRSEVHLYALLARLS